MIGWKVILWFIKMFFIWKRLQCNDYKIRILELFILRINIVIGKNAIKLSKKTYRKNELWARKILPPGKGKKLKKIKSFSKCSIKRWYKFGVLFLLPVKFIEIFLTFHTFFNNKPIHKYIVFLALHNGNNFRMIYNKGKYAEYMCY